jgi:hypothetical protein
MNSKERSVLRREYSIGIYDSREFHVIDPEATSELLPEMICLAFWL